MCLAPCFKGCTDDDYAVEVARVRSYMDTAGQSLVGEISQQRDQASETLDFENAAAQHARLEKLKPVLSQLPEIVHRIDRLTGVIVQPSVEKESVAFFRVDSGCITGPRSFSIQPPEQTKSRSMESRVQEALEAIPVVLAGTPLETMEHVAILRRWYYRGTRVGEIFFADDKGLLPLRRVVRGISRVYRGESPEPETAFPGGAVPGHAAKHVREGTSQ